MTKVMNIYTATLAKVYADQGHLEKAAEIYRTLLEKEPGRTDLVDALSEIEKKLAGKKQGRTTDLVSIFSQWIDLADRYGRRQKLKKLRNRLEAFTRRKN
jgi:tetratricopeptide (TPR) repeat protein